MRILIIEDDKQLAESLKEFLEKQGFSIDCVLDGETAEKRIGLYNDSYDMIILDRMLPGEKSGDDITRMIRAQNYGIPILMLTGKTGVDERIEGLDLGADDYLTKPFSPDELLARIRAILRRPKSRMQETLKAGDLTIDLHARRVFKRNREIPLTLKEFSLLEFLVRHRGEALSREEIFNHLWDFTSNAMSNVIDVHVHALRKKIWNGDNGSRIIETIPGIGYRLNLNDDRNRNRIMNSIPEEIKH